MHQTIKRKEVYQAAETRSWYYANGNKAEGPYTEYELRELFNSGVINKDSYIVNNLTMHEWKKYSDCIPIPELPNTSKPLTVPPIKSNSHSPNGPKPPAFTRGKDLIEEETETVVIPVNDYHRPSAPKPADTSQKPAPPQKTDKSDNVKVSVDKDELAQKFKNLDVKNGVNVGGRTFSQKTVITAVVSLVTLLLMFMDFFKVSTFLGSEGATLFEMGDLFKNLGSWGDSTELSIIGYLGTAAVILHIVALVLYLLNSKKNKYFSISMEVVALIVLIIYYLYVKSAGEELYTTVSLAFTGILCYVGCVVTTLLYGAKEQK